MDNTTIARRLLDHAATLETHGHNLFRVRSYRQAAAAVLGCDRPLDRLLHEEGSRALAQMPGVGKHLAFTLEHLVRTGELRTLGPEAGPVDPERMLTVLPGVGPKLALRLREELGIETMDEMEEAARSGRLRRVGVYGERLGRMIVALEERRQQQSALAAREPSVDDLLAIDREFRTVASERGEMRCYPGDTGAVMVLQTERGGWKFRATFSATPLAQRLGLTRDWVVLHFDNGREHGQRTVVTETRSQLHGRRVVRGRERECSACWAS